MLDPTFRNINRFFFHSFKNSAVDPARDSFAISRNHFNIVTDNEPFFDQPVTNKKRMKNLLKCQEMMIIQQETY